MKEGNRENSSEAYPKQLYRNVQWLTARKDKYFIKPKTIKTMFQFIYNIIQSIVYSIWIIIMTIITGKMIKVSPYHFDKQSDNNGFFDICRDKYIKINHPSNVSDSCKKIIIADFIDYINRDEYFYSNANNTDFPIFSGSKIVRRIGIKEAMRNGLNNYILIKNNLNN